MVRGWAVDLALAPAGLALRARGVVAAEAAAPPAARVADLMRALSETPTTTDSTAR
jgi:hypothetical protein